MFRNLAEKLRSMVDAGKIKVTVRNGRMLLVLPNDILFDSGKSSSRKKARPQLRRCEGAGWHGDRHFLWRGTPTTCPSRPTSSAPTGSCPPKRRRGHPIAVEGV